ncbi:MAG: PqiC family protein [Burkholderiales bacterium]
MNRARVALMALAAAAGLVAGCGTTPDSAFYTLKAEAGAGSARESAISIVVGPVTVPEAVDRPELVVRTTGNRVRIEEFHRWVEPLKAEIPRVIAAQLGRDLDTPNTGTSSDVAIANPDFRVLLDIQRFESQLGGDATVDALWTVRTREDKSVTGRTIARESVAGGYESLVAAHRRALATVSRAIAEAIKSLQH